MTKLNQKIYNLLKMVPRGKVTTYKLLSLAAGTKAYRTVGQILKHNPDTLVVPCHRVVKSDGTIGGFNGQSSEKEIRRKKNLLISEGISFRGNKILKFKKALYQF